MIIWSLYLYFIILYEFLKLCLVKEKITFVKECSDLEKLFHR